MGSAVRLMYMNVVPLHYDTDFAFNDFLQIGGSGSCSVMRGETIAKEKVRTKYIVNAAGCYSVIICSDQTHPRESAMI
jgi:hypothetical protein